MKITILTEKTQSLGYGHYSRCLALQQAFESLKYKADLLVNNFAEISGNDLVIVDSYLLGAERYQQYKKQNKLLGVIDDYSRIEYPTNSVIINPALGAEDLNYDSTRYILLLGARYSLLRKSFWYPKKKIIKTKVKNILITLGSDMKNLLPSLKKFAQNRLKENKVVYSVNLKEAEMFKVMSEVDIAISTGGQTIYELAACGVPTIAIKIADNQNNNLESFKKAGLINGYLDHQDKNLFDTLSEKIETLNNQAVRTGLSIKSQTKIDGLGAMRLAKEILINAK